MDYDFAEVVVTSQRFDPLRGRQKVCEVGFGECGRFTSLAATAAAWGALAGLIGLTATFVAAGVLLIGAATVPRWPMLDASLTGRNIVSYWPDSEITPTPDLVDAPVLVSLRYAVAAEQRTAFLDAMADLRNTRLRTGGTSWALYRDARDETAFVEQYTVASWAEHRQRHEQRLAGLDQKFQERIGQR